MNLDIATIPEDIAKHMVKMGRVEWGAVKAKTDAEHIADFGDTLHITRKNFSTPEGPQELHGVFLAGSETVMCHTGTSPNSPTNAQIMAGLWNSVLEQLTMTIEISLPNQAGAFVGDIWFGDPIKRNLGTHRWDGEQWHDLPDEIDSVLALLAKEREVSARLGGLIVDWWKDQWGASADALIAGRTKHGMPSIDETEIALIRAAEELSSQTVLK